MDTIIDVSVADGHFKTLAKGLTATGRVDTLQGAGPFTVFAPSAMARSMSPEPTLPHRTG